MNNARIPQVGDVAILYVAGGRYLHVVTAVISPKAVEVQQGEPGNIYGPRETITLLKNGRWVEKGKGFNSGYYWIDTYR